MLCPCDSLCLHIQMEICKEGWLTVERDVFIFCYFTKHGVMPQTHHAMQITLTSPICLCNWSWFPQGELVAHCFKSRYTLQVNPTHNYVILPNILITFVCFAKASTYQMAILLQFNSTVENPVSHLEACTQLSRVRKTFYMCLFLFCFFSSIVLVNIWEYFKPTIDHTETPLIPKLENSSWINLRFLGMEGSLVQPQN